MARQVAKSVRDEVRSALRENKPLPTDLAVSWGAEGLRIEHLADAEKREKQEGESGGESVEIVNETPGA